MFDLNLCYIWPTVTPIVALIHIHDRYGVPINTFMGGFREGEYLDGACGGQYIKPHIH